MTISGPTLSPLSSFHLTWEASQLGNVFDRQQRQYTPLPLISARSRHEIGSLHLRSLQKLGVAHIRRAHTFAFDRRDHFGIALVDALVDRREVHAHGRTGGRGGSRCAQHVPLSDCERADGEKASEKHRKSSGGRARDLGARLTKSACIACTCRSGKASISVAFQSARPFPWRMCWRGIHKIQRHCEAAGARRHSTESRRELVTCSMLVVWLKLLVHVLTSSTATGDSAFTCGKFTYAGFSPLLGFIGARIGVPLGVGYTPLPGAAARPTARAELYTTRRVLALKNEYHAKPWIGTKRSSSSGAAESRMC